MKKKDMMKHDGLVPACGEGKQKDRFGHVQGKKVKKGK